jgi:hypothetical protein
MFERNMAMADKALAAVAVVKSFGVFRPFFFQRKYDLICFRGNTAMLAAALVERRGLVRFDYNVRAV